MTRTFAFELAYWQQTTIRVLLGLVALLLLTAGAVYLYLFKFVSFMQSRLGPMEAGPFGSLQLVAEVGKWLQKEDISPDNADKRVFRLAPFLVLVSALVLFVVIPAGPNAYVANLGTGIFFVLAVSSISTIGVLIAGWSSSNKYALIGALRAAGQLIAYELPLILAVIGVVIQAGTWTCRASSPPRPTARSSASAPSATPSSSPRSSGSSPLCESDRLLEMATEPSP